MSVEHSAESDAPSQAATDVRNLAQDKATLSAVVTTQRLRAETAEAALGALREIASDLLAYRLGRRMSTYSTEHDAWEALRAAVYDGHSS